MNSEKQHLMDARVAALTLSERLRTAWYACPDAYRSDNIFQLGKTVCHLLEQLNEMIDGLPLGEPIAVLLARFNAVQIERNNLNPQTDLERVRELEERADSIILEIAKTHTLYYDGHERMYKVRIGEPITLRLGALPS